MLQEVPLKRTLQGTGYGLGGPNSHAPKDFIVTLSPAPPMQVAGENAMEYEKSDYTDTVMMDASMQPPPKGNKDWEWHILVTRSRINIAPDTPDAVVLIDEHARDSSLGWNLTILRMKKEEEEQIDENTAVLAACPWLGPKTNDDDSFPAYSRLNVEMLSQYQGSLRVLPTWPLGAYLFLLCHMRVLLHWRELVCNEGDPMIMIQQALQVCSSANDVAENPWESRLIDELSAFDHSKDMLLDARRETPTTMHFHLSYELMEDATTQQQIRDTCQALFPSASVVISGACSRLSSSLFDRIFWSIDFNNHMDLRFNMLHGGNRSSPNRYRGRCNLSSEDFWGCGNSLVNLPSENTLKQPYEAVSKLLATRPWSRFKGFEILKVTIASSSQQQKDTKWIMISSNECNEADMLTKSPFGFIQIFQNLDEKNYIFGRSALWLAAGLGEGESPPDRLFLASESIGCMDYDSILLMEELFGESLASPELPRGVIPLIEAETGSIPSHAGCSQPTSSRRFTEQEMDWVRLVVPCLTKFVTEERSSCDPMGGEYHKTYDVAAEARNCSTLSEAATVDISYNMGIENGGIWDRERKWEWF